MARIINLNQQRKQKARQEKSNRATENAAKFGRTAAQKKAEAEAIARQQRELDQARVETPPSGSNLDTKSP